MAINLHKKYETKLAEIYTHNSFVEGHTNKDWSFSGVKSILIPTLVTQPLNDYQRSGTSRYGTPTDLQDTAQEMTMTQDKGFAIVIDKGDNSEQQMMKSAGHAMKRQISEQVVPVIDKICTQTVGRERRESGGDQRRPQQISPPCRCSWRLRCG